MKIFIIFFCLVLVLTGVLFLSETANNNLNYGAPPYIEEEAEAVPNTGAQTDFWEWTRPNGPLKVALQAGHYRNNELPDELARLRESGGGTSNGSVAEWEVNLAIAEEAKRLLEKEGIEVDILPATIPPAYFADAVIAIHADGSINQGTRGFKAAAPRRDASGRAGELVRIIEEEYQRVTNFSIDSNISRNMTGYYAFSSRRFAHATHPMAPAVILETGFLTNPSEASVLINSPEIPAQGIANSVLRFLKRTS
jgi:N-acetylmuramoyl-L-alanine amidase